jgi:C1A family cysteine protease
MRKLGFMKMLGVFVGITVLCIAAMPVSDGLPAQAAEPPQPQAAPLLPPPVEPPPVIDGHGTGFVPPGVGDSQAGQGMAAGSLLLQPPPNFDWRTSSKVTSVKDQGACGACYAFAAIGNVESKVLIDTGTNATPGPDYSENNAKECNYYDKSCGGGTYYTLASLFSQRGIVDEVYDPYVPVNVSCNSTCPYNKTLLNWSIISTNFVPNTTVLQNYIQNNGPVYTTLWVDGSYFNSSYDGSFTFNYSGTPTTPNHAVLIVGWGNGTLPPDQQTGMPGSGWIVKNSWGPGWGAGGYFYMHYKTSNIGMWSSFMDDWQDYDNNGGIMYYDDDFWNVEWSYGSTTGWGLCNFTPAVSTTATRVEFWTTGAATVDVYLYDNFTGVGGGNLSKLLTSELNRNFTESGYHSVPLSSPVPLTAGDPVIVVVNFTNVAYTSPIPADSNGPIETNRTYISYNGANGTWYDIGIGSSLPSDVAIRLRTSGQPLPPGWYWKEGNWTDYAPSGMPDFDQRQDNWTNNVTGNWSYCGPVSAANSLWWFDSKNEPNPVPPPAINDNYGLVTNFSNPWDDHDVRNVQPLVNNLSWLMDTDGQRTGMPHNGTNVYDMQWGIDKYLINTGFYGYYYERTVKSPDFYWIEEEIERCEDVILLLGFWQEDPYMPMGFARVGGHYVTCAGVNSGLMQLGISDPCRDNAEAGGPGRVPVPHPYPHNSSVHNDTQYVSHDIYNVTLSPSPGGFWGLPGYGMGINFSDFQGQNCPPEFEPQQGIYNASLPVFTEIEYAVDVSPKPDLNEVIESDWVYNETSGNVTIRVHVIDPAWDGIIWDIEMLFWTEESGTQWPYKEIFTTPLEYCTDYYFNVPYPVEPEIVVVHFSNEMGENIGFAFSYPATFNLTVVSAGCCPIDVEGLGTVPAGGSTTFFNITGGTTINLTANDSAVCCLFNNWTVDGLPVPGNPIAVTMNSDHTAVATCTWLTYDLTVTSAGCCNITVSGAVNGTVAANSTGFFPGIPCCNSVTLNATATGNCVFDNWTVDGFLVGGNPIVVHMDANHSAVATCHQEVPSGWYWKAGNWTDYALSGMPDFDQKQDAWTNPRTGSWSYCGPVAVADSLWWFDSRNETSPVPPPAINDNYYLVTNFSNPWDDHDVRNVQPLVNNLSWLMDTDGQRTAMPHNGTNVLDMQWGIDKYLVNTGYYGYYYEKTVKNPNFSWIEAEIERCEDVVLLLGFWEEIAPDYWVRVGGHYVTCAGVNSNLSQLGISDPDFDNAGAGGPGRVPVPHPYPHNSSVHNDTQYVSHDIYNVVLSPSPGGTWGLENYAVGKDLSNFQFQNCPVEFEINQSEYLPFPVYTEIEYAVAVSPKPDLNDVIDSDYVYNETDGNISIRVHVINETWNATIWDIEIGFWTEMWGTEWVYNQTFAAPLLFCEDYYFNLTYPVEPEIVVVHFSNEPGDNIGFAFSTPQALNATLIGHMTFPGTDAGRVMTVRFFDNATQTEMGWSPLSGTIDAQSNFTIANITPGLYDISVKNCSCLSEVVRTINLTAGNTAYVNFGNSREGDCNGNDWVTLADQTSLYGGWGKTVGQAGYTFCRDLNRDNWITLADRTAMYTNWGASGDLVSYP